MFPESDWEEIRGMLRRQRRPDTAGFLRTIMVFSAIAIALAAVLAPLAQEQAQQYAMRRNVDTMATGSIQRPDARTYVIRRSVLQQSPDAFCIINRDGSAAGDC